MATRSIVSIRLGRAITHFYRHHDGMPYRAGRDLAVLLERTKIGGAGRLMEKLSEARYADQPGRLVYDQIGCQDENLDIEDTDADWLYEIAFPPPDRYGRLSDLSVRVHRRGQDDPAFMGDGVDFVIWISDYVRWVNFWHEAGVPQLIGDGPGGFGLCDKITTFEEVRG